MDETTTNDAPVVDAGVAEQVTQPDVQEQAAADDTTAEHQPDTSTTEPDTSDTSQDDDLSEWASKKGLDLSTPEGQQKALKSLRESEKAFHSKSQEAADLTRKLSTPTLDADATQAQQALAIANSLQNEKIIREWQDANGVTKEENLAMGAYTEENPRMKELLLNGQLTLDELRAIAVPAKQVDTKALKQEGGQEALEKLANKQRATAVQGNAVSTTPTTSLNKGNVEAWYDSLGTAGRKNPENQVILQSILSQ